MLERGAGSFEDELNLGFKVATMDRWISAVGSDGGKQMEAETEGLSAYCRIHSGLGWMQVQPFRGFWEDPLQSQFTTL